jgi:hypothetical protein
MIDYNLFHTSATAFITLRPFASREANLTRNTLLSNLTLLTSTKRQLR